MSRLLDPVSYYKASRWLHLHRVPLLPRFIKVFSEIVFHCELPYTADIGPGFQVAHRGFGIVVHPRAVIGRNVEISPCVTIGGRSGRHSVPRIGDNVFIATGAKVLGDVMIGNGAVIGANAVVIHSVPPRSVAAGVPARIIRENINTMEYTGRPEAESIPAEKKFTMAKNRTCILMFIHSLDLGGSEAQCVEVARKLKEEGYRVTVGCLRADGPLRAKLNESGVECVEFPVRASLLRPNAVLQMLKLVAFIRKRRFEVVHTHDLYSNLFAVPAAWLARVPIIISSRRDLSRWWWYTPARRKILRRIQGFSTRVLVNSEAVRQDLIVRDGFDPERIVVVYNGIDLERYIHARADRQQILPGVSPYSKNIVMVANMHVGVKGHGDLIEAARTVRERFPESRFLLAGDGEMRPFFEDQVRAFGLTEMFTFLGHRTDIPQLLSSCDIGVLASRSEGLPNAVLEYLAAGLPVVATAVGGVPEIIENEVHGLLIPPENPAALSAAILRLLENPQLRANFGKAGQERVRTRFSFQGVLNCLRQVYGAPRSSSVRQQVIHAGSFSQIDNGPSNLPL